MFDEQIRLSFQAQGEAMAKQANDLAAQIYVH